VIAFVALAALFFLELGSRSLGMAQDPNTPLRELNNDEQKLKLDLTVKIVFVILFWCLYERMGSRFIFQVF
jgi:Na+/H+ antiporter NhaC